MGVPKNWVSILGKFELANRDLVFQGGVAEFSGGRPGFEVGQFVSDAVFGGGTMEALIEFQESVDNASAGLILYYHPDTGGFVSVALGVAGSLCAVSTWGGQQWTHHAAHGPASQLMAGRQYKLEVSATGSRILATLDGVRVVATDLQFTLPRGQSGVWALGPNNIKFSQFAVSPLAPKIFVVMQFTEPFNELYQDVIYPVGTELGFEVVRADDTYGPGIIIADISNQISESTVIIADITPNNPNVYWEVGYAHALHKPTILIAERDTTLPFDVSPFRTLFYDNTIAGKAKIEMGLRKHIEASQRQWSAS